MATPGTPGPILAQDAKARPVHRRCLAIPVFQGRVAPVLDTCTRLVVMDPRGALASGHKVRITPGPLPDRVQEFRQLGIRIIVCGALSEGLFNLLVAEGIELRIGIAGDLEAVAGAFKDGTLALSRYRMPGASAAARKPKAP